MEKNGEKKKPVYKLPNGGPIEFYTLSLQDCYMSPLNQVEEFFNLLYEEAEDTPVFRAASVLRTLWEHAMEEIMKRNNFIKEKFGTITVDLSMYNQPGVEGDRLLGMNFTPKDQPKN